MLYGCVGLQRTHGIMIKEEWAPPWRALDDIRLMARLPRGECHAPDGEAFPSTCEGVGHPGGTHRQVAY